jgi:hypothetical protein
MMTEIIFDESEDWEKRILCNDGSCIGTIGSDGNCKECGKPYEDEMPTGNIARKEQTVAKEEQTRVSSKKVAESDDDWDTRVLCSDESCIGTIGPNGQCRECGRSL